MRTFVKGLWTAGALLLMAAVLASTVHATVIVPADLVELTRDASAIARGRVVAIDARWTEGRRTIETLVTLQADQYLKGSLGDTLQFRVPGGTFGRFTNIVVGAPQFAVGQHVIVFLGANGPMVPIVLGLNQGVFRVTPDAAGDWTVLPPPALPQFTGRVVRGGTSRAPLSLTEFERQVRALGGRIR